MSAPSSSGRPSAGEPPRAVRASERAFLILAGVFILAAAVVAILNARTPMAHGWWLVAYLSLVGGIAQILLAPGLMALARHSDTTVPGLRHPVAELVLWNTGTVLVAVADLAASPAGVLAGSVLLVIALAFFLGELRQIRTSVNRPALEWRGMMYLVLLFFLGASVVVGTVLAYRGRPV